PTNFSPLLSLSLKRFLNIYNYFHRRQIVLRKDRAVIEEADQRRIVTPRWKPVAAVPIPITAPIWPTYIGDGAVMGAPVPAIVPDTMVSPVQRMRIPVA